MDFSLSDEQGELTEAAAAFARQELKPAASGRPCQCRRRCLSLRHGYT